MPKNKKEIKIRDEITEFLLYTSPSGEIKVEVYLYNENIWLTQEKIAELFGVQRPAITKHLKNIFAEGELEENSVSSILEHTTLHGAIEGKTQTQKVKYYNLDAIIAVGYRVNSEKATQFRIWATKTLKEYILKGFILDDKRLKNIYRENEFEKNSTSEDFSLVRKNRKLSYRGILDNCKRWEIDPMSN